MLVHKYVLQTILHAAVRALLTVTSATVQLILV